MLSCCFRLVVEQRTAPVTRSYCCHVIKFKAKYRRIQTYRSAARNVFGTGFSSLKERLHFLASVVACIVMRSHDTVDDFSVIIQLSHHFGFLSLHARGLHSRQNLGFFAFRHSPESYSCEIRTRPQTRKSQNIGGYAIFPNENSGVQSDG